MPEQTSQETVDAYVAKIKQFRKEIDANIVKSEAITLGFPEEKTLILMSTRELSLVRIKLQEAKMWAGKILEVIGTPFPAELADKADKVQ